MTDPMQRFIAETSALETSETPKRRTLLDRMLRRGGGRLPAYSRDPDPVPAFLSPGRFTRKRPGESWAEATNRLTEGHDL